MIKTYFFVRKYIYYILFFVLLYSYIYNPFLRVLNFGVGKIVSIFALLYLFYRFNYLSHLKYFKIEIILLVLLVLYSSLILLWGDGSANAFPYLHFQLIIDGFFVPLFFYFFFRTKLDLSKTNVYLILIGFVASLITIYLFLNPALNFYIRDNIIVDDIDSLPASDPLRYLRGFTFSDSSTFGYGITQGLVFGLALYESKRAKKYLFLLIPLLISIMLNARIGFVVSLLSIILLWRRLNIFYLSSFIFLLIVGVNLVLSSDVSSDYAQTIKWISDFIAEFFSFILGKSEGETTFDTLSGRMLFFPNSLESFVFGEGRSVFGKGSDMGYVNQMFYGGILYVFLLITMLFVFFKRMYLLNSNRFYSLFFVAAILIANIKGPAMFTSQSFWRFILFLHVIYICVLKENKGIVNK